MGKILGFWLLAYPVIGLIMGLSKYTYGRITGGWGDGEDAFMFGLLIGFAVWGGLTFLVLGIACIFFWSW